MFVKNCIKPSGSHTRRQHTGPKVSLCSADERASGSSEPSILQGQVRSQDHARAWKTVRPGAQKSAAHHKPETAVSTAARTSPFADLMIWWKCLRLSPSRLEGLKLRDSMTEQMRGISEPTRAVAR